MGTQPPIAKEQSSIRLFHERYTSSSFSFDWLPRCIRYDIHCLFFSYSVKTHTIVISGSLSPCIISSPTARIQVISILFSACQHWISIWSAFNCPMFHIKLLAAWTVESMWCLDQVLERRKIEGSLIDEFFTTQTIPKLWATFHSWSHQKYLQFWKFESRFESTGVGFTNQMKWTLCINEHDFGNGSVVKLQDGETPDTTE